MENRTENRKNNMEFESDLEEDIDMIEARNEDVDVVMEDPIGNDENNSCDDHLYARFC